MSDNRFNPSNADRKNPYENLAPRDPNPQPPQVTPGQPFPGAAGVPGVPAPGQPAPSYAGPSPMGPSSLSSLRTTGSASIPAGVAQFPPTGSTIQSSTVPSSLSSMRVAQPAPASATGAADATQVQNPWGSPPSYPPSSTPSYPPSNPPSYPSLGNTKADPWRVGTQTAEPTIPQVAYAPGTVGAQAGAGVPGPKVTIEAETPMYKKPWFVALLAGFFAFLAGFAVGEGSVREELDEAEAANSSLHREINDLEDQVWRLQNQGDGGGGLSDLPGFGSWFDFGNETLPDQFPGDGVYLVGYDVDAGTYETAGRDGCSWMRVSGGSADEDVTESPSGPAEVTIEPGDLAFVSTGCADWTRVD